jgi:hypothetical protein
MEKLTGIQISLLFVIVAVVLAVALIITGFIWGFNQPPVSFIAYALILNIVAFSIWMITPWLKKVLSKKYGNEN